MIKPIAALALCAALAGSARADGYSVAGITLKLFDETTGKVLPLSRPPNPYGQNLTLMVIVKVKGSSETSPRAPLVLDLVSPGWSDEATGDHAPWKETQQRALSANGEGNVGYQLFILPYQCRMEVSFTATLGKSTKTIKQMLGCAE